MSGKYEKYKKGQDIIIPNSQTQLQDKIKELVNIHKKIWIFLIKIDRCESTHTKKIQTDVCNTNQKIFFPPAITQEVFLQKQFLNDDKEKRNYLVNREAGKIKNVFYKGDGSDGNMYRQKGTINYGLLFI